MKLHIKNGRVVDPKNKKDGKFDLILEDEKVKDLIGPGQNVSDAKVIDASGCIVSPGFIDLHTHLREPGYEYKETIETGTKAAAAGGFTSLCCMANTNPINDQASITEYILKKAQSHGVINVYPIGALTKRLEGKELSCMGELLKAGCVAVSDDGHAVRHSHVMRLAMEYAKNFGLLVITHSIDPDLADCGVMNEGIISTELGLSGIPNQAEEIYIARDIYLAELTGVRLHVAHVATKEGVALIKRAKEKGLPVTCEVAPHHFTLTDAAVVNYDTNTKISPPLRSENDRQALIQGMKDGVIDAIATDHAPHASVDKELDYLGASFGVVGLETALSLALELVDNKGILINDIISLFTSKPAHIMGFHKGSLEKGADADVVIFNPDLDRIIDPSQFYSKSKNTPFAGRKTKGQVFYTIVGGKVVYNGHL